MLESSFTGVIRTVFIIIGVITILRLLGRVMQAKRNQSELRNLEEKEEEIKNTRRNTGRIDILNSQSNKSSSKIEDVDFEELKD
jgi:Tfp pilus assembly protein PilO